MASLLHCLCWPLGRNTFKYLTSITPYIGTSVEGAGGLRKKEEGGLFKVRQFSKHLLSASNGFSTDNFHIQLLLKSNVKGIRSFRRYNETRGANYLYARKKIASIEIERTTRTNY